MVAETEGYQLSSKYLIKFDLLTLVWYLMKMEFEIEICYNGNPWSSWWRHQMETFSALLALCTGNSPVTGEFPEQRPVTWSFDVFFDLRLNKLLSKQSSGWWFETPSRSLWRHCNVVHRGHRQRDDVMALKHFPHYWLFVKGICPRQMDFPDEGSVIRSFYVFFVVSLEKLLTVSSCR